MTGGGGGGGEGRRIESDGKDGRGEDTLKTNSAEKSSPWCVSKRWSHETINRLKQEGLLKLSASLRGR